MRKRIKTKRIPEVRYVELTKYGLTLIFCQHQGDVYFPSVVARMSQEETEPLASRADIEFIRLRNGICLFPSKWLAAAKPEFADAIAQIRKILLQEIARESNAEPNQ